MYPRLFFEHNRKLILLANLLLRILVLSAILFSFSYLLNLAKTVRQINTFMHSSLLLSAKTPGFPVEIM